MVVRRDGRAGQRLVPAPGVGAGAAAIARAVRAAATMVVRSRSSLRSPGSIAWATPGSQERSDTEPRLSGVIALNPKA
ncbi:hypothetical protein OG310_30860 [Streptomyces sp. NBC_01497]|nr:hypothetical protein [Streptomyces sp. NBC_01497]